VWSAGRLGGRVSDRVAGWVIYQDNNATPLVHLNLAENPRWSRVWQ